MQLPRTLFLLAGYPGVGKSTLLTRALTCRIPLFGEVDDPSFQSIRLPPRYPESEIPANELLECGTWFAQHDIPFLAARECLPDAVLIHVDLISLFALFQRHPVRPTLSAELRALLPRTGSTLANRAENASLIAHLLSLDFFRRFERHVVNTVHAPWETIARQWRARASARGGELDRIARFVGGHVLNPRQPRRDIHQAVYGGWLDAISTLNPVVSMTTEIRGSGFALRRGSVAPGGTAG